MDILLELDSALSDIQSMRRHLDRQVGEARALSNQANKMIEEIKGYKADLERYEKVVGVLNKIGNERQETAQLQIEALVTQGLRTIFGEELSFHVVSSTRGKAPITEFIIRSQYEDGRIIETSVADRGGGYSAVVGLLLRLVILLLSSEKQESIIFLDEAFAHVSSEYGQRLAEFIKEIVEKTGVKIVVIAHTHVDEFMEVADKSYIFKKDSKGYTMCKEL